MSSQLAAKECEESLLSQTLADPSNSRSQPLPPCFPRASQTKLIQTKMRARICSIVAITCSAVALIPASILVHSFRQHDDSFRLYFMVCALICLLFSLVALSVSWYLMFYRQAPTLTSAIENTSFALILQIFGLFAGLSAAGCIIYFVGSEFRDGFMTSCSENCNLTRLTWAGFSVFELLLGGATTSSSVSLHSVNQFRKLIQTPVFSNHVDDMVL